MLIAFAVILGVFLITLGVAVIYWPAGLIVGGVFVLTAAVLGDLVSRDERANR